MFFEGKKVTFVHDVVLRNYDFRIGGDQRKLKGGQSRKAGAVIWQYAATSKEAVPPSYHKYATLVWTMAEAT